jgi:hypothetical protein
MSDILAVISVAPVFPADAGQTRTPDGTRKQQKRTIKTE